MVILKRILLVIAMFIGTVIVIKLVADAFAKLVLWTGSIWGMEYR